MTIKTIKVKNFKSFKELHVDLGKFNVLIGANASGKSNFIEIFKFLRDIATDGLDNAISLQGGAEFLTNLNIGMGKSLSIDVVVSQDQELLPFFPLFTAGEAFVGVKPLELAYSFSIGFSGEGVELQVVEERLDLKAEFSYLKEVGGGIEQSERPGVGNVSVSRVGETISVKHTTPEGLVPDESKISPFFIPPKLPPRALILGSLPFWFGRSFDSIAIYDFDPKLPKKATPITGKAELEEKGNNLAIVLKRIIENKDQERRLANLLQELLPFVSDLKIEKFADKSFLFKLSEIYTKKHYLPASFISDGTINITALIVALYFERKPIAIIEEPERNIHPFLISRIVGMMKDASQRKQIIVTTHNPEVVRNADLGDILLVSRNGEGFSTISRPSEKEDVRVFLQNEMGLEELFVQNLLRA